MLFQPMKKALHTIPGNTDNATPVGASLLAMDSNAPRSSSSPALSLTTIAAMRRPDKPAPTRGRVRVVFHATPVGASLLAMDSSAPRSSSSPALSLTTIAGRPAPTRGRVRVVFHATPVGASLLAMDSNAPRSSSSPALSLTTIAGKPAPTRGRVRVVFSRNTCRSQPAGDGLKCAAFIQFARDIVNDHRWQASSHKGACPRWNPPKKNGRLAGRPFFFNPKLSIQPIKCPPSAMASAILALVKSLTLGERKAF